MKLICTAILLASQAASAQTFSESMDRGLSVYEANCTSCHGRQGLGAPSRGIKALDQSAVVLAQPSVEIQIVLNGVPPTIMPAWGRIMSNNDIAAVITYTKNSWNNKTGQHVLAADIAATRLLPIATRLPTVKAKP